MNKSEKLTECREKLLDLNNKIKTMSNSCDLILAEKSLAQKNKQYLIIIKNVVIQANLIIKNMYDIINEIIED